MLEEKLPHAPSQLLIAKDIVCAHSFVFLLCAKRNKLSLTSVFMQRTFTSQKYANALPKPTRDKGQGGKQKSLHTLAQNCAVICCERHVYSHKYGEKKKRAVIETRR
jgi:hypothetical protein